MNQIRSRAGRLHTLLSRPAAIGVLAIVVVLGVVGCSEDDDDDMGGGATPTASPTPDEGGHFHAFGVGSTEDGAGALAIDDEGFEDEVSVLFDTCIGGTGDQCTGGMVLYSNTVPGFNDDAEEPLHALADGTPISLELVAISAGASVRVNETMVLDAPGAAAELGTTPEFHNHPQWQVLVAAGEEESDFHVAFKLTTPSSAYAESEVFEWSLVPSAGDDHHDDDSDDDDEDEDDE